ncbi:MAG TPA: antibiotic biosynthesis monooxygenase [Thermoleophilia bacterium]|nr:antibiotic biosynthesis monooxygenase [Thermoleophilia bacterium]
MYARAVNIQFHSAKIDEANRIVQDAIVPVLKEQKGFREQFLLTQSDTGKAVSINLWETEADLTAFESSQLYRELMGKLAGVIAAPPAGERYEVSVLARVQA